MVTRDDRLSALNRKLLRDLLAMKSAGVRHRDGRRRGRGDVRDVPLELRVAAGDAARVLRAPAVRGRLRLAEARAAARGRPTSPPSPASRRSKRASSPTSRSISNSSKSRPSGRLDLDSRRSPAAGQRPVPAARALDRARTPRRGAGQRRIRRSPTASNPGDTVPAVINGRLRRLTIVGVALSPEYIYSIRPGELVPDERRFGIFWMDRQALAAAFDMEGGFNDVALSLAPGASPDETIAQLDRMLEPYGGLGAIPRALQLSHWTRRERARAASELRLASFRSSS